MFGPYRRACQIAVFILMFVVPTLNLYEIYAVTGTFYSINIGGLGVADPVVLLQAVVASTELSRALAFAAIFPIFLALLFGRIWCGWMCPYHLVSDVACAIRDRVRSIGRESSPPHRFAVPESLRANTWRFGFLIVGTLAAGAVAVPVLNYVHAPGILSAEAMIFIKERSVSLEFAFIVALVLLEILVLPRFWCRLFCPTGAFISLFRFSFTLRVKSTLGNLKRACCEDLHCERACPMGLKPALESEDFLCTNCGLCIDACKKNHGRSRLRFSGFRG